MNDFTYLDPAKLTFALSENGILSLDYQDTHYDPAQLVRLFPFQYPDQFLSVSANVENEPKELGMIRALDAFPPAQKTLLNDYLTYKYFIPRVEKIGKIEEKLGYVYMDITTVLGRKTICISDVTSNIRLIRAGTVTLIDVQGNRYYMDDLDHLDRDTRQKIDLYI